MKSALYYLFLITGIAFFAGACNKNADDSYVSPPQRQLDVVNALDVIFNIYQNGTRLSNSANIYVPGHSGFLSVNANAPRFSIKKPLDGQATTVLAPADTILSTTFALDSPRYTLFICGTEANPRSFHFQDKLPASPAAGAAQVRFIHAAPQAGTLTISLNDTVLVSSSNYQSVSAFSQVSPAQKTIKIFKGNSTVPAYTKILRLASGNSYTLFARDTATFVSSGLYVSQ